MFELLRRLTEVSTQRPKATLACVLVVIMALSSGAQHLVFDSSEDGFFPDDSSVDDFVPRRRRPPRRALRYNA